MDLTTKNYRNTSAIILVSIHPSNDPKCTQHLWLLIGAASLTYGRPQIQLSIEKYSETVQLDPTFFEAYEGTGHLTALPLGACMYSGTSQPL